MEGPSALVFMHLPRDVQLLIAQFADPFTRVMLRLCSGYMDRLLSARRPNSRVPLFCALVARGHTKMAELMFLESLLYCACVPNQPLPPKRSKEEAKRRGFLLYGDNCSECGFPMPGVRRRSRTVNGADGKPIKRKQGVLPAYNFPRQFRGITVASSWVDVPNRDPSCWLEAARAGHAQVLRWAAQQKRFRALFFYNPGFFQGLICAAARGGHLELVIELDRMMEVRERDTYAMVKVEHRRPFDNLLDPKHRDHYALVGTSAAEGGHIHVLKWLCTLAEQQQIRMEGKGGSVPRQPGVGPDRRYLRQSACTAAARGNQLETLKWLRSIGVGWNQRTAQAARKNPRIWQWAKREAKPPIKSWGLKRTQAQKRRGIRIPDGDREEPFSGNTCETQ